MQRKELKSAVLKLAKDKGCLLVSSVLKELNYGEDVSQQSELYEIIYELMDQDQIYYSATDGYISDPHSSLH